MTCSLRERHMGSPRVDLALVGHDASGVDGRNLEPSNGLSA